MQPKRPASLVVMGILNIVIGALTLLCGVCDGAGYLFLQPMLNAPGEAPQMVEEMKYLNKHLPGYLLLEIGRDVAVIVLAALLVMAGIGLLLTQSWGRCVSIIYALVSIPLQVGWGVYKLAVVLPLADQWQKEYARQHQQAAAASQDVYLIGAVLVLAITILPLIYCVVLLIFMFLPGLSTVFNQDRSARRRAERYEEDEDGDEDEGDYDPYERRRDRY